MNLVEAGYIDIKGGGVTRYVKKSQLNLKISQLTLIWPHSFLNSRKNNKVVS